MLAAAHESRTIGDGRYQIEAGFMDEPAFAGDKNGLKFLVTEAPPSTSAEASHEEHEDHEAGAGTPVEGLEEPLKAEVIFEGQTLALPLRATFGEPGGYSSVFFPIEAGDYTFRIYGTIGDTDIDETFTSSPESFSSVADPAAFQFPQP